MGLVGDLGREEVDEVAVADARDGERPGGDGEVGEGELEHESVERGKSGSERVAYGHN